MEEQIITTDKILNLGFIEKGKKFTKYGFVFKKHPTMNWLVFNGEYLKTMNDLYLVNDKIDLSYSLADLCTLIDKLVENNSIPDIFIEWAYNSRFNSQNLLIEVERRLLNK